MGLPCESCEGHVAAYVVTFDRPRVTFKVCWICMTAARRGARPPAVAVLPAESA